MEISLKRKYRIGGWAKKVRPKSSGDGRLAGGKNHKKITDRERRLLAPQPQMVMHIGPTGKARMIRL